jgi:hypothetical protein
MTSKPAGAWAREFQDPAGATWRVRLVRLSSAGEFTLTGGRVGGLALYFENGIETRRLEPVPPDWRECDQAALWHSCQVAQSCGVRRALTADAQRGAERQVPGLRRTDHLLTPV